MGLENGPEWDVRSEMAERLSKSMLTPVERATLETFETTREILFLAIPDPKRDNDLIKRAYKGVPGSQKAVEKSGRIFRGIIFAGSDGCFVNGRR